MNFFFFGNNMKILKTKLYLQSHRHPKLLANYFDDHLFFPQSPRRQSDMGPLRQSSSRAALPPIRRNTMTSTSLGSENSEPSSPSAYPNHALFSIGS